MYQKFRKVLIFSFYRYSNEALETQLCYMIYFKKFIQFESQVFINLKAALDYLALKDIDADLAVISSDVDDLTDEDEIATPLVRDVPALLGVENAEKKDGSDMPCRPADPNPLSKSNGK